MYGRFVPRTNILPFHGYMSKASDSVTDFSVLLNPIDAQNASCLGLCCRYICLKSYAYYGYF